MATLLFYVASAIGNLLSINDAGDNLEVNDAGDLLEF